MLLRYHLLESPKVAITTNYAISGKGNSFARRKWDLELSQFYTKEFTPLVEFGKLMFGEWNDNDWCQFDNYMIKCLQLYLEEGLIEADFVNKRTRDFDSNTSYSFVEWCGGFDNTPNPKLIKNKRIYKNDLFLDFTEEYPDYAYRGKSSVSRYKFGQWLVSYAEYKYDTAPLTGRDQLGRWIEFVGNEIEDGEV